MTKAKKKPQPPPAKSVRRSARLQIPAWWKSPWVILGLLVAVGFGFRFSTTLFTPLVYPDSVQYLSLAQEIHNGSFFRAGYNLDEGLLHSRRLPLLYPFLLALFPGLINYGEYIGGWISLLFSLATFVPVFLLGRRLDSPAGGLLAAALFTFPWFILRYASPVLTEATFTFFFTLALVMGYRAMDQKHAGAFALAGVVSGLAYLTREVGITLVVLTAGFSFLRLKFHERLTGRRVLILLTALFVGFSLCSLPYWLHIRLRTGRFSLSSQIGQHSLSEYIMRYGGSRIDRDRIPGTEEGTDSLDENASPEAPPEWSLTLLPALALKILKLSSNYAAAFIKAFGWFLSALTALTLLGFLVSLFRRPYSLLQLEEAYFWVWSFHLLFLYALLTPYMVDERYLYPLTAPAVAAGGIGVMRLARKLATRRPARGAGLVPFVSALVVLAAFISQWPDMKTHYQRMSPATLKFKYSSGYKEAARFLRERQAVPPGKTILARKPFAAYYLQGRFLLLPKTVEELNEILRRDEADYLAVDTFTLSLTRPLLLPLAYPDQPPKRLRVIYNQAFPEFRRVITIYDLNPSGPEPDCTREHHTPEQHLQAAAIYLEQGQIYNCLREARLVLEQNPQEVTARRLVMEAYRRYYLNSPSGPTPLSAFIARLQEYLQVNPSDQKARQEYEKIMHLVKEISPGVYVDISRSD